MEALHPRPARGHRSPRGLDSVARSARRAGNRARSSVPTGGSAGRSTPTSRPSRCPASCVDLTPSVYVGICKGDARLPRRSAAPTTMDNRAIRRQDQDGRGSEGRSGEVERRYDLPTLRCSKLAAGEKIVIDGKADEKAWGGAASTGPFVDVGTGKANTSFPINGAAEGALGRRAHVRAHRGQRPRRRQLLHEQGRAAEGLDRDGPADDDGTVTHRGDHGGSRR